MKDTDKKQHVRLLDAELDKLILLDAERAKVDNQQAELNQKRSVQIGRMQAFAEQAGVNLDEYVGEQLANGRARKVLDEPKE